MIEFTQAAIEKLKDMAIKEEKYSSEKNGIRVMVLGGGCAGFTYDMDFENETREDDLVNEQHGWTVYVDVMSSCYLEDVTVNYVEGLSYSGFQFDNPDAKRTCGCGSSFG